MSKMTPQIRFQGFTDDWEQYNLGELTSWNKGQGLSKDKLTNNGIGEPALHYADLYKFRPVTGYVIHWTNSKEGRPIPNNSILFPASDVTPKGLARTTTLDIPGVKAGGDVIIGQLQQEINAKFLSYQINANSNQILPLITGTTVKHIQSKNLSTLKVTIPNKDEQNVISRLFDNFENLIVLHQCKLELLKKQKKGFLQKMFPKNGAKVPELRFSGFDDDWEERKLGELMEITSVKRIHQSDWTNNGIRFLRARDIVSASKGEEPSDYLYISEEKYEEYSKVSGKVQIGDLLVTGVGTIGVPMLVIHNDPLYFKDGNIIWFKNQSNMDGNFFYYSFIGMKIQKYIRDVAGIGTVGTYTIDSGKKTPISLPNIKEQQKIGSFLKQLDNTIALHQRKLDLLKEQKKGFLQKMFVS